MAESEAIDQDTGSTLIGTPSKMNFALVIFRGIEDSYTVGSAVECRYTVSGGLTVSSRDWVGLYKVGWRNQSDFYCYEWAPQPKPIAGPGSDLGSAIQFTGSVLPKDDGEFYQFCYVTAAGQVRGASTPFQFKQYAMDDLIEVEDENGELLIIKTKTAVLEDQLKKANETRLQLKQEIQIIENEKDMLKRSEAEMLKKLQMQRDMNVMADEKIKEMQEQISDVTNQNEHLQGCIHSLQERIEIMNQEKLSMESRLDDSDRYIGSLQEKIKALVNEKDTLTGRVKSLEEEKELYKGHFTTSEDTLQSYVQECEKVKVSLMEEQASKYRVKKELERIEAEMSEQRKANETLVKSSQSEKENMAYLTERMRNAEDKLSAAEHCKMMLNEEVLTLKLAYEKASADLEKSRLLVDRMNSQQASSVSTLQTTIDELTQQIRQLEASLSYQEKEASDLKEELALCKSDLDKEREKNKEREEKKERGGETEGPLYALTLAQQTLKERYAKLARKNEDLQKLFDQATSHNRELMESDDDQKKEIRSLRDRLLMGQEAYKEKYIEWERLETEMYRMKLDSRGMTASKDSVVTAASGDSAQIEQSKDQTARARKYKHLYLEQKRKMVELSERLANKDLEIEHLRRNITASYPPAEYATVPLPKPNSYKAREPNISFCEDETDSPYIRPVIADNGQREAPPKALVTPLKPLPAPILPERLHASRITHYNTDIGLNMVSEMLDDGWTNMMTTTSNNGNIPTAPPAEPAITAAAVPHNTPALIADATASLAANSAAANAIAEVTAATVADNSTGEEERYEDACGDMHVPMTCPCCDYKFTVDNVDDATTLLDAHFNAVHGTPRDQAIAGQACPFLCGTRFSPNESQEAIQQHVDTHVTN